MKETEHTQINVLKKGNKNVFKINPILKINSSCKQSLF